MNATLTAFIGRWDVDAATRTTMPFDRAIALVNLRRAEVACLLEIGTDILQLATGYRLGSMFAGVPVALGFMLCARAAQRWRTLAAQRALTILFVAVALALKLWGTVELGQAHRLSNGYSFTLLTLTLLLVVPPRTMAILICGMMAVYVAAIFATPLPLGEKLAQVVSTGIISVIALVADWLIFRARRADHELRMTIRSQNEQLLARNDELDQLMAITAHDLRSPLYGLRNLFDLAQRRAERDPQLPLKAIREGMFSLDAMIALVTRLLHAHAAEHRPLQTIVREDVRSHLIAAARRIAPQAEAGQAEIVLDLPDYPVCGRFDTGALAQILDNLLSNAVRFTPRGMPISLACHGADGSAFISVSDRGPGIAPALRPRLFSKFGRGAGARDGTNPGIGMGLFIAARLAERLGATLSVLDREQGGAVFCLLIPDDPNP